MMAVSTNSLIRVLLVDDHVVVRSGLRLLIETRSGLKVVGEASTREQAITVAAREQPDIILLDLDLNGASSLDCLNELLTAAKDARVIILTGVNSPEAHQRAVHLGAVGLVLKEKAPEVLIKAIERVHMGEIWLDRSMLGSMLAEMSRRAAPKKRDPEAERFATLTEREREIISLVGTGLKNKQIAARLFISEATVRHHLTSIFNKLDIKDRLELIIYVYTNEMIKPQRS